jgi:hypothetical protein
MRFGDFPDRAQNVLEGRFCDSIREIFDHQTIEIPGWGFIGV